MKRKFRMLVLLGLLLLIVPIARGLVRPPAAIAEPRYEAEWEAMVRDQREEVREGGHELVFIGDSITEFWNREGQQVWAHYYEDRSALNLGVGADRTENVLWRIDHSELDRLSPKVAVLMIGTNNYQLSDAYAISEATITIVDRLEKIWPNTEVLVVGILPAGFRANPHRAKMDRANERTERLLKRRDAHYLNVNRQFMEEGQVTRRDLLIDTLHLSDKGYQVWAEAMEPTLSRLLGAAPKERLQSEAEL